MGNIWTSKTREIGYENELEQKQELDELTENVNCYLMDCRKENKITFRMISLIQVEYDLDNIIIM